MEERKEKCRISVAKMMAKEWKRMERSGNKQTQNYSYYLILKSRLKQLDTVLNLKDLKKAIFENRRVVINCPTYCRRMGDERTLDSMGWCAGWAFGT